MNDLERLLTGSTGDPGVPRLRATLAARAHEQNLLDVAYRIVDTPVGQLLLAATPVGLVRVAYARQNHDAVLTGLASQISPRVLLAPRQLDDAARQLDHYFAGRGFGFELSVDLRLAHGFRRAVLEYLPDVGYGRTVSYGQLATLVGRPGAARAVGSACATNPLPLIIPCHRVVLGDGSPGGYVGGPEIKRVLLDLERDR
jgi:methylated-DNA-[protein]-cysteine S-methyltransferase